MDVIPRLGTDALQDKDRGLNKKHFQIIIPMRVGDLHI